MSGITCAMCEQDNKKHCDSHIFPLWIFKTIIEGDTQNKIFFLQKNKYPIEKSKGIHQHIGLCTDCDCKLGRYDEYMKVFTEKDFSKYYTEGNGTPYFIIPNTDYDYKKLKKFFISLLWRASLHRGAYFKDVNLGEKYASLCVKYLNDEIDDIPEIRIVISKLTSSFPHGVKNILLPIRWNRDKNGLNEYLIIFCGFKVICTIDKRMHSEFPTQVYLSPKQLVMPYLKIEDCAEWNDVVRLVKSSNFHVD